MYAALDRLMAAELPQMELYCEIGRLVCSRPEKGAAAAAAEYLQKVYSDASGFSPRNLRRMRDFYKMYGGNNDLLNLAMQVGWTQNVVILEADLTMDERTWYLRASEQFGWSKSELINQLKVRAHETITLDIAAEPCYINVSGGDEDGSEETPGTFLQGLRDAEVQRELQRQGPRGPHMQSLFPPLSGTTGGADDSPPPGKSAAVPPDRERDYMAEKPRSRSQTRGKELGLYGLRGKISARSAKPEKARAVDSNPGIGHRWRCLRFLWRPCLLPHGYQGVLP